MSMSAQKMGRMSEVIELFHDGGCYHIETSPLICYSNQWTGFYMIMASVMKELNETVCAIGTFPWKILLVFLTSSVLKCA